MDIIIIMVKKKERIKKAKKARKTSIGRWPDNKQFAFTIVDDTEYSTVFNTKPIYDLLDEIGLKTTKTVWVYPSRDRCEGSCIMEEEYLEFIKEIQDKGFEIGLHNVGSGAFHREEIIEGIEIFKDLLGIEPTMHINHDSNPDNIYWGAERYQKILSFIIKLFYRKKRKFYGTDTQSTHFWGDICKKNFKYIRNYVFNGINTLKYDPKMPYKVKKKEKYSNYWFSSADAHTSVEFNNLLTEKNIERLKKEQGCCILYTQLDQILLGTYLYPEAVAYYAIGQKIMIVINGVVLSVMEVALPRLSNYSEKGNEEEYISLLNRVSIFFFAMLFPIAMGITALSREIIVLFGGDQYLPATGVLSIFGIYMIGVGIQYIISKQILYVKGKERIIVGSVIGGGVLNLMMNILLLSLGLFTPQTAIITTCVAIFFQVTIMYTIIRKYMKIDYKLLTWDKLKYLAISISFIPIAYLVRKILIRTSKVTIVTVVVCAAIYLLFLILIKDSNLYFVLERIRVGKNKEELIPSQKGGRGMNIQEFRILKLIHRNTKQNLLEISEQMGLSQGTVKNLTYYLLENTYIKQNFKGEYTITSKGLEMIEEAIIKTAVILAAGIKPETNHIVKDVIPKELLQIDEKTLSLGEKGLVERSIQILLKNGIERIIIVTGHQSRFYNELTERYKCVYVIENIDYASTGSMASLAKIVDFIDSNFILLENHLIYEEKAIKQLQNTEKKDCILISNIANSGDEVYVEIINNNINKISKSKEALGSIYGEWVGITKISKELLDLMMLAYSKTTNPYYDYKYAIEDVARNYMVGFQKIDHLIWTKVKEVSIND